MDSRRNSEVDTLRGIACILLVAYHVVGSNAYNGLEITEGFARDVNDLLAYLRMPLFTFLSGVVYAYRPFHSGTKTFLLKKVRRLLLPMLTVGTTFALLRAFTPGTNISNIDWTLLHIKPVGHFWFIEAIFTIFVFIVIFEKLKLFRTLLSSFVVLLISCCIYVTNIEISYFAISGTFYLLPYFLFGMILQRFNMKVNNAVVGLGIAIILSIYTLIYTGQIGEVGRNSIIALFLGLLSCYCLFFLGFKSSLLMSIGVYSYSIYLFHVFFTAGARIFAYKIGMESLILIFSASLFAGILGPIITDIVLSKVDLFKVMFLGKNISGRSETQSAGAR